MNVVYGVSLEPRMVGWTVVACRHTLHSGVQQGADNMRCRCCREHLTGLYASLRIILLRLVQLDLSGLSRVSIINITPLIIKLIDTNVDLQSDLVLKMRSGRMESEEVRK